jgi:hypothetical protein
VSGGIVGHDSAEIYIENLATDKELLKLSQSEIPILRAVALRTMLDRPTFNHFDLIMNHLDDTAIVPVNAGEWGMWYRTVSDYLVEHGKWKDTSYKAQTIDAIITKHNYLRSAYLGLSKIKLQHKHYKYIKEMIERERPYYEIDEALYALASFKKAEDIQLIKKKLLSNNWRMSIRLFDLMKDFPDELYMEVLKKYYSRNFYRLLCKDQDFPIAASFFNTVASYKSVSSQQLLSTMLHRKPFMPCPVDTYFLKQELVYSIWNNDCPVYASLRKQIAAQQRIYEAGYLKLSPDTMLLKKDTVPEPVYWW